MPVDQLVTQWVQRGLPQFLNDMRAAQKAVGDFESQSERMGDRMTMMGGAFAGALTLAGAASLRSAGQMQMTEIAFTKLTGSAESAREKIDEIRQLDRESPFSFKDTLTGAQRLMAVGVEADKVKSVMTDIGDATAAVGGTSDDLLGIARALTQMRTKGTSMEEINQLADRGIPALRILQKQLNLTDAQLKEFMKGDLKFEGEEAFNAMLKGFRELYGGTMKEASKTLPGQISNLQSAFFQLGETIGNMEIGTATTVVQGISSIVDKTSAFVKNQPGLAKLALAFLGIGAAVGIVGGQILKLRAAYNMSKLSVDALRKSVVADTAAEAAKAVVAGKEGKAISGVGDAATDTAKKLGLLQRVRAFMGGGLSIGGRGLTQVGGRAVTGGMATGSLALGAAAGYGAYDDTGNTAYGMATGVAAAAASMFLPGAAVPIAIATGFRYAFNELVNRPMERAAEAGSGMNDEEIAGLKGKSRQQVADEYLKLAERKRAEGDNAAAEAAMYAATSQLNIMRQENKSRGVGGDAWIAAQRADVDARAAAMRRASGEDPQVETISNANNGDRFVTIRLPESRGDRSARRRDYKSRVAAPSYGGA